VALTLNGAVQDEAFVRFLERLETETQRNLAVEDLVVLDAVRRGIPMPPELRAHAKALVEIGALERIARGKLILSKGFYALKGVPGEYTRQRGLDRNTQKALLIQHIKTAGTAGAPFEELAQVLPAASRNELRVLLRELRSEGQINVRGITRAARWYANQEAP
jgi:ATP-dependent DNA helicase RecG